MTMTQNMNQPETKKNAVTAFKLVGNAHPTMQWHLLKQKIAFLRLHLVWYVYPFQG